MKSLFSRLSLALVLLLSLGGVSQAYTGPASFADETEAVMPAVVNISTTIKSAAATAKTPPMEMPQFPPGSPFEEFFKDFMDKQNQQNQNNAPHHAASLGSGFIIDAKKGLVVTNNHVIADAEEINVILQDNTSIKAELVGKDAKMDLAVLRIKTTHPLVDVKWGDSDKERVGDWVLAIGNPFGLGGTVTSGIVSARARNINAGPYDDFIQTDAPINRGNSGGPMFDMNGRRDRHQHRDLFSLGRIGRYRLCHPIQPRQAGRRSADPVRQDQARLAGRAHPGRDRRYRR